MQSYTHRRAARTALFVLGAVAAIGCTRPPETVDSIPPATALGGLQGVVRTIGSSPVNTQTVLQPADGGTVRIVGPLASELARLGGIEVIVRGEVVPSSDPVTRRQIEAQSYEIVQVNGQAVVVGEVVEVTSDWARLRLGDGKEIYLNSPPAELRAGQKIWVQGQQSLSVQSYGVIRP